MILSRRGPLPTLLQPSHPLKNAFPFKKSHKLFSSSAKWREPSSSAPPSSRTRNIGIIAHIDAGKTTTTERMLYYGGVTRQIGNVDQGSTITDFLPAERARGVTIQSAAIAFTWPPEQSPSPSSTATSPTADIPPHTIQLIDTPGHADFTFEVQRSLRILDGAIVILDAVAGVEAQTEKVWYQASCYCIPKIVYVNKLDREGAAFARTVKHVASRLHVWPAVCHVPWWEGKQGQFVGVGDAVGLRGLRWREGGDGREVTIIPLEELEGVNAQLAAEIKKARAALVELLSENDEAMVEKFLEYDEDPLKIPASDILTSLRRCTVDANIPVVPVFAGASFRNIGVQTLLDAAVQLLPCPEEALDPEITLNGVDGTLSQLLAGDLQWFESTDKAVKTSEKQSLALMKHFEACALAFKVVYDPSQGPLVYVRVYSGTLKPQTSLFNSTLQAFEKAPQLWKMYANAPQSVPSLSAGQIGVIPGLKVTRTGDTLIQYSGPKSQKSIAAPLNTLQLRPIDPPPAVFYASVEPNSMSEEKSVKEILSVLVREDPSLRVTTDPESNQTLLGGMGEFHLEIAGDRLIRDLKAKCTLGAIEILYREGINQPTEPQTFTFDKEQNGKPSRASCIASVIPIPSSEQHQNGLLDSDSDDSKVIDMNRITILIGSVSAGGWVSAAHALPSHLTKPQIYTSLLNGALAALARGIKHPYPLAHVHVTITLDTSKHLHESATTLTTLTSLARHAVHSALQATALTHGTSLLEMHMNVTISVPASSLGAVSKDISSSRAGQVLSLDEGNTTAGPVVNEYDFDLKPIDLEKVYVPPDPYGDSSADESRGGKVEGGMRTVVAQVPLKEMVGYLKHLRSLTGGRGTFTLSPLGWERVVGMREKEVLKGLRG